MKNPLFEYRRRKMKENLRNNPWKNLNKDGLRVFHMYGGEYKKEITWWDDVGFVRNNYKVMVWWVHPRMDYRDKVETLAQEAVPYPDTGTWLLKDWFSKKNANYKKVGKSRKKITSYTASERENGANVSKWMDDLQAVEENLLIEGDVVSTPSFKVETLDWCRGVSICAPMEMHSEDDLKALVDLVKKLLNGETTMKAEFGEYKYTRENWVAENPSVSRIHGVNLN